MISRPMTQLYKNQYSSSNYQKLKKRAITAKEVLNGIEMSFNVDEFDEVFDYGFGDGSLLELISAKYPGKSLSGYEVDESAYNVVSRRLGCGCRLLQWDEVLMLGNHHKVLGVSSHVLEHVEDPRDYLRKCFSITPYWIFVLPLEHTLNFSSKWCQMDKIGHINAYTYDTASHLFHTMGVDHRAFTMLPSLEYHIFLHGRLKGLLLFLIKQPVNYVLARLNMPLASVENIYISTLG